MCNYPGVKPHSWNIGVKLSRCEATFLVPAGSLVIKSRCETFQMWNHLPGFCDHFGWSTRLKLSRCETTFLANYVGSPGMRCRCDTILVWMMKWRCGTIQLLNQLPSSCDHFGWSAGVKLSVGNHVPGYNYVWSLGMKCKCETIQVWMMKCRCETVQVWNRLPDLYWVTLGDVQVWHYSGVNDELKVWNCPGVKPPAWIPSDHLEGSVGMQLSRCEN